MIYYEVQEYRVSNTDEAVMPLFVMSLTTDSAAHVHPCCQEHEPVRHRTRKEAWDCFIEYVDKNEDGKIGGEPIGDKARNNDGSIVIMVQ